MKTNLILTCSIMAVFLACGCGQKSPTPEQETKNVAAKNAAAEKTDVVKIVFVGQKQACDCTRKRIDDSWKTLQGVLGADSQVGVERIQLDVDQDKADKLDELRSLMVAPGLYFFDANEHLVEMLQGEVTADQISKVL